MAASRTPNCIACCRERLQCHIPIGKSHIQWYKARALPDVGIYHASKGDYESRLATWREWQPVSELAQGDAT